MRGLVRLSPLASQLTRVLGFTNDPGVHRNHRVVQGLAEPRERMARVEGLLEGLRDAVVRAVAQKENR